MSLNFSCSTLVLLLVLTFPSGSVAQPGSGLKSINLDITTQLGDQQIYFAGDSLSFMLSLDQDAYVYLFYQDSAQNLFQLLPNAQYSNNFLHAGYYLPLPDPQAAFSFKVEEPFGTDRVWAFALDRQVAALQGKALQNGLILMSQTIDQIRTELKRQAQQFFDESSKQIITRPAAN